MSTTISTAPLSNHHLPTYTKSSLTEQLEQNVGRDEGDTTPRSTTRFTNVLSTPKPRSLSDGKPAGAAPSLSPSPAFREPSVRRISKDDSVLQSPSTPRRPTLAHNRGLSLTMPSTKDGPQDVPQLARVPLSPKLEASNIYGSPSPMLPRRSRGLDYTRACTNLHHSTLAESSPDASPITGRGMQIPQRRSLAGTSVLDSPSNMSASLWSTMPEKTVLSSSVSSVNMLDSSEDSDSSSDNDMAVDQEREDPMLTTPAISRLNSSLMGGMITSPGMEWQNPQQPSPAQASLMSFHPTLMSFRRARTRKGKSQHSSSSVSMHSSKPSPGPLSPGVMKGVENNGYFGGLTRAQVQSRRESLSLGTNDLHLSDSEESKPSSTPEVDAANSEGPRGVIKRAVTRRSNLLPKTRGFARIKAALLEEAAPADNESKREAEVIKQVQDNDPTFSPKKSPPTTNPFSPDLVQRSIEESSATPPETKIPTFTQRAERNSAAGPGFWNAFDERYRTPPPSLRARESSSAISDETNDTPAFGLLSDSHPALRNFNRSRSRSTTPLANYGAPTAGDVARRVNNKRRRDDDFDPSYTKRRAVSPGMSVASSPVLPQSPVMTADKSWGKPPPKTNAGGERSNSGGSVSSGMKKVGMQGMNETNDGLMSMSID